MPAIGAMVKPTTAPQRIPTDQSPAINSLERHELVLDKHPIQAVGKDFFVRPIFQKYRYQHSDHLPRPTNAGYDYYIIWMSGVGWRVREKQKPAKPI
jgi:hypothetical protein